MELLNYLKNTLCKVETPTELKQLSNKDLPPVPNDPITQKECNYGVQRCIDQICNQHGGGVNENWNFGDVIEPDQSANYHTLMSFCNTFGYEAGVGRVTRHWGKAIKYIFENSKGPGAGPCNKPPSNLTFKKEKQANWAPYKMQMTSVNLSIEAFITSITTMPIPVATYGEEQTFMNGNAPTLTKSDIINIFGIKDFWKSVNVSNTPNEEENVVEAVPTIKEKNKKKIYVDIETGNSYIFEGGDIIVYGSNIVFSPCIFGGIPSLPLPSFGPIPTFAPIFAF